MQLLRNRYQILQVLSNVGAFGQTFLAKDIDTPSHRRCVIKKLRPKADLEEYQLVQERFEREAAILEKLGDSSDQIPTLYAYFVENQEFYLVQELIEGVTLRQKVQQQGTLSEGEVKEILVSLLNILTFVHQKNIIHRDIKPDNVILRQYDKKPVLIDFGIVKEVLNLGVDGNPTSSIIAGTPGYTALEQAAGRPVFASDLFSLGAMCIFLLTGKNPQQMTNLANGEINWQQYVPQISNNFARVLDKSIKPFVTDRYQTAIEMNQDLQKTLIDAQEIPTVVRPIFPQLKQKSRLFYLGVPAFILLLLFTFIGGYWLSSGMASVPNSNRTTNFNSSNSSSQKVNSKPSNLNISTTDSQALDFFNRGENCTNKKDFDCAIENYTKAIKLKPSYSEAFQGRGWAYYKKEKADQSIEDCSKALELQKDYAQAYACRGNAYFLKREFDKAMADCDKSVELKSDNAKAYICRGNVYFTKQNFNKAFSDYEKAIKLDPNNPAAIANRGMIYVQKENYQSAFNDFNKALELDPDNAQTYNNRGIAYANQQKYDQALKDYNKAIELKPDLAQAYYNRGIEYIRQRKYDDAIADFQKALEIDPNYEQARENLEFAKQKKNE